MSVRILYIVPPTGIYAGIERVIDEVCSGIADAYPSNFKVDVLHLSTYKNFAIGARGYNNITKNANGRISVVREIRGVVKSGCYDLVVVPQIEATVISWLACIALRKKFILYLHGNHHMEASHIKAKILFLIMRIFVLRRLSGVFGVSPTQIESFRKFMPSSVPHYWTPNPVRQFAGVAEREAGNSELIYFVNVGRFSYQKGQDDLVEAFAEIHKIRKNVRLKIVGYGNEELRLRAKVELLGLESVVQFEYYPDNPHAALLASDVYVSTSRWEGWGLAICEALRFGIPIVATDCDFGPSDILTDPRLGILVALNKEKELVKAMLYYCDNIVRERKHARYRRKFVEKFNLSEVIRVHADALLQVSALTSTAESQKFRDVRI
jgi:glycosyltransferase involved in cell wall biosynthesis